jgi:hypothetical protein
MVLRLAVRSGAIRSNPVTDLKVARGRHAEMVFLDVEQITKLAIEVAGVPVACIGLGPQPRVASTARSTVRSYNRNRSHNRDFRPSSFGRS